MPRTYKFTRAENKKFADLYKQANFAGRDAVKNMAPITPMVIVESDLFGNRTSDKEYVIKDGPCGFAWVDIRPLTSRFGRWLTQNDLASKDDYYKKSHCIWISDYGQSIAKKEVHAYAMAKYLSDNGIKRVYASSRMD
jgi:hypothetical protein